MLILSSGVVALPTPATHLTPVVPPHQVHLQGVESETALNEASVTRSHTMPPRYWQIHNSLSASPLQWRSSADQKTSPSTIDTGSNHGGALALGSTSTHPQQLARASTLGSSSSRRNPSSNEEDLITNSTCTSSPLSPISLRYSSSQTSHDHHYRTLETSLVHSSESSHEPLFPRITTPDDSNQLEIRNLRRQVEILAEANARLTDHDQSALWAAGSGPVQEEVVEVAPPAYSTQVNERRT
ncbi:hypothetical protein D9757_010718 [Collybiopsis confluens]|uniref:Uncharacterized protein n=1 Tax=Collybiopsis confluens TaxID=2823264 RepID=A0A8H5LYD6_9AGAR|nr:hypothetical protein D9757_010718 [Collybiopsis confluens]